MTDAVPPTEEQEYIPDPEKENQARGVHFMISVIRLMGVFILVAGIIIATDRLPPLPSWPGYVLILIALFQMWFVPVFIIRRYVKARVAEEELAQKTKDDEGS